MQLSRVIIKGYKSLQDVDLELRPLNVLIGPNGAGKSNLISLFGLLGEMIGERFQLAVRKAGGSEALLYRGRAVTDRIVFGATFHDGGYRVEWEPTASESLVFAAEESWLHIPFAEELDQAFSSGHQESRIAAEARLKDYKGPDGVVANAIHNWRVYHFHDTSSTAKVRLSGQLNDVAYLRADASNLAAFLREMRETERRHYDRIIRHIRSVAPYFDNFVLEPLRSSPEHVRLDWLEVGSDYPLLPYQLSDGTLRFICLATLLLQPNLPSTILIDEPELGLHPTALSALAGLLTAASEWCQIIVTTQSVRLVDEFQPEDLVIAERRQPEVPDPSAPTTLRRLDSAALSAWLEEYSLGELWQKNVLGGKP